MKDEIRDLALKLERGEIDKAAFDDGVRGLIDEAEPADAGSGTDAAGEQHAARSREIRFAAKRAREL